MRSNVTVNVMEKQNQGAEDAPMVPFGPDSGLVPHNGEWTYEKAAHLLRRTTFGPTYAQIKQAVSDGLAATVDKLLENIPLPTPPINYNFSNDSSVPVGTPWVEAPWSEDRSVRMEQLGYRWRSLNAWAVGLLFDRPISIREKMVLFWHNHFPVNDIEIVDPRYLYNYTTKIRERATGNFRELTKEITIDPSMLRFLNGNRNEKGAPNENYARELLELFTIGKGPQIGPGDYSNYTEEDVKEIARALTGWVDHGYMSHENNGEIYVEFVPNRHDQGTKKLSYHFDGKEIGNSGADEYTEVVDIIFQNEETARFICRKLYLWFVDYKFEDHVEEDIIIPMSQILIASNYEIKPILRALLMSDHFYNPRNTGIMIKNPADFTMSLVKSMELEMANPIDQKYDAWYSLFLFIAKMQMGFFHIQEVAGWEAYYRAPMYYRSWVNSSTIPLRLRLIEEVMGSGIYPNLGNGKNMKLDPLQFIRRIDNPSDPNAVIEEFSRILLPKVPGKNRTAILKEILLPGLPDFEWTVEYNDYAQNPDDPKLAAAIRAKLAALIKTMISMPEFQLG